MLLIKEAFNMAMATRLQRLQPMYTHHDMQHCICGSCRYVNELENDFCTNCGHPLHNRNGQLTLYSVRQRQRKDLLLKCETNIQMARNMLYILSAICITGIGFGFSELDESLLLALLAVLSSGLFFFLGKWSVHRPFTALLMSIIVILTYALIAILGKAHATFTTVTGVYGLFITILVLFLLLRGLTFAFKADLVKEEMEIM